MEIQNHPLRKFAAQEPIVLSSAGYGKSIDWRTDGVVNPVQTQGVC